MSLAFEELVCERCGTDSPESATWSRDQASGVITCGDCGSHDSPRRRLKAVDDSIPNSSSREQDHTFVSRDDVAPSILRAAELGRRFAGLHLGRPEPPTRFYIAPPGSWGGYAERGSNSIAICVSDVTPKWVTEVAAHETFHLAQTMTRASTDSGEADAKAYGRWAAEVLAPRGEVVGAVHAYDGFPWELRGIGQGDVVVAQVDGSVRVYRNAGIRNGPIWREAAKCSSAP